jgi:23S rRNA (uridine2552-2'-O)-methyltransferase
MSRPRRSSSDWRTRQEKDPYVQQARREGWRSRAVFKLEQIDRKERLLRPGMRIVDLGAAPGSWSQYVTERLDGRCRVIALDLLPMDALPGVEFIQGDFREAAVLEALQAALGPDRADLVLSDMAPNITGTRVVDQPRAMYLVELAVDLCQQALKAGGDLVCKLFQGQGSEEVLAVARQRFERVRVMKPDASRSGSREVYLVARNYQL